jgi:hypothetical protein
MPPDLADDEGRADRAAAQHGRPGSLPDVTAHQEIAGDPREACAGAAAPDGITGDAESEIAPRRGAGEEAAAVSSSGAVTLGEIAGRLSMLEIARSRTGGWSSPSGGRA